MTDPVIAGRAYGMRRCVIGYLFQAMVCHLVLCKLRQGLAPDHVEEMMRRTRMSLLKIDAALSVRCGRAVQRGEEWEFFVAVEAYSMERLAAYREHAIYVKYVEEVLKPNTECCVVLDYEMDPARVGGLATVPRI